MEFVGVILGLSITALILIAPIIALIRAHRAARISKESRDLLQKLIQRVHALETRVQELQDRSTAQAVVLGQALPGASQAPAGRAGAAPAAPPVAPTLTPAPVAAGAEGPPAPPTQAAPTPTPGIPQTREPAPPPSPALTAPVPVPPEQAPAIAAPNFALLQGQKPASREAAKRVWNLEEVLGTDWLNKLGIISVVMGVAFFLAHEMQVWGPGGKVLVGFAVSGALLGAGLFFEREERWRVLARAALAGGWALLYFTTYAMNHIGAARILRSESWDFILLVIVAAAMVAHTLRYQSRVVTGLAFLLAFTTINISRAGATSLFASALLALALVVIVGRRRWFDLEVIAILALFINHYYWLRPIIEPMGEHHHAFPELIPSTILLFVYWLVFRFSYIFRRILERQEENISTLAAILNTFLFHYLIKYQSVHPELAFWFLLGVGTVEMALGQLPITRRRRTAFVILTTLGALLLIAAFPYRYSGGRLSIIWLAEAEALLLAGVFTREILFRWLGVAAEVLVAGHMFLVDTHNLSGLRDARAMDFSDPRRTVLFAFAALMIFANAVWIPRRWPEVLEWHFEKKFYRLQSYLAGFLLLAAVWAACPEPWLAVGFAACALLLAIVGARGKIDELSVLANCFAVLAFLRVVFANFALVEVWYVNVRVVISIALAAALLYASSRWIGHPSPARTFRIPESYTWVATFVVALLAWYQLWPASAALAWGLMGLILFEWGFRQRSASLRLQSYVLFLASFFRIFFVNFNAEATPGQLSPRLYSALPLAVLFYFAYAQLADRREEFLTLDARLHAADVNCFLGTLTVAAAIRFELGLDWIAAAWAALVLLFMVIARQYGRRIFLAQALLLTVGVFFRAILHNFYQRSYFPPPSFWQSRWTTVGTAILLMFLSLLVARRLEPPKPEGAAVKEGMLRRALTGLNRNSAHAFFFVAFILLTGLLYAELRAHGMATVAWGAEAVGVFLFALGLKERIYRLGALTLLLVCVVKIAAIDVWGLAPRDRYLTFMALGVALFSVSFLYTRYREVLRAYL